MTESRFGHRASSSSARSIQASKLSMSEARHTSPSSPSSRVADLLPLLALTLGYDKATVGVLLALFALPQVVLALPAGRWTDRRGVKVPIRASVVVCALGAAIAVAWPIYPVLCVSALFSGAGIAAA